MKTQARPAVVGPPGADLVGVATAIGCAVDERSEIGSQRLLERVAASVEAPPSMGALDRLASGFVRAAGRLDGPLVGHAIGLTLPLWQAATRAPVDVHLVVPPPGATARLQDHRPRAAASRCWVDHVLAVLHAQPDARIHPVAGEPAEPDDQADPWTRLAMEMHASLCTTGADGLDLVHLRTRAIALVPDGPATLLVVGPHRRLPRPVDAGALVTADPLSPREIYDLAASGWRLVADSALSALRREPPRLAVGLDDASLADLVVAAAAHAPLTAIAAPGDVVARDGVDVTVDLPQLSRSVSELLGGWRPTAGPLRTVSVPRVDTRAGVTSVVVPVHGQVELTQACLEALRRSTTRPLEVIVVDDASPDDTARQLAAHPAIDHLVRLPTNRGFAGAVNAGLQVTTGEFVCVLNNDTEPVVGWLEALLDALAVPETGCVGPRTNRISGRQAIAEAPGFDTVPAAELHAWATRWRHGRDGRTWRIPRLVGFCLLTRRDLLVQLGGFDEGVGRGNYEDDEWCSRVRRMGLSCRVAEDAVVLHHGSATFRRLRIDHAAAMLAGARHTVGRLLHDDDLVAAVVDATGADPDEIVRTLRSLLALTSTIRVEGTTEDALARRLGGLPATVRVVRPGEGDGADVVPQAVLHVPAGTTLPAVDVGRARSQLEGWAGPIDAAQLTELVAAPASVAGLGAR